MKSILLVLILASTFISNAQFSSKLYQEDGTLIAHSDLKVTTLQFEILKKYEFAILNAAFEHLHYPQLAIDKQKEGSTIVSFSVDDNGALNDFRVEKRMGDHLDAAALNVLIWGPQYAEVLKPELTDQKYTYYLPVRYILSDKADDKYVEDGWIIVRKQTNQL